MSTSPFVPHALRAGNVPVRVEPYTDPMQSIRAIARSIVEGAADKDVRGVAGDILIAAGIDGRSGHSIREKAQAVHAFVCANTVFAPDPIRKEFVVSAAGLLCLRQGLCIRVGDCDDMTGLIGALLESLGIIVVIIRLAFTNKPQEHVLVGAKDERGNVLAVDGQHKEWIVGESSNKNVAREILYDPHEVQMETTGIASAAELVTFGAVPTVPLENTPHWDRASRSYWQRRNGLLWRHDAKAGVWRRVDASTGVGYVDAQGKPRDLAWDGARYWEKRGGRWFYRDGEKWIGVPLESPIVDELYRVVEAENRRRSSLSLALASASSNSAAGMGATAPSGGDVNDEARARIVGGELQQALFTLQSSVVNLETALESYAKTRSDLGLPEYEATGAPVRGPSDFVRDASGRIVWSSAVTEYSGWILKFAYSLITGAQAALHGQRGVGFTDAAEIQIAALPSDRILYALDGVAPSRTIRFVDPNGNVLWTMDENGQRSVPTPPPFAGVGADPVTIVLVVVAVALTLVATYFIVSKICDTITTYINEKTSSTIAEAVKAQKITPEDAAKLLKADADRRAAILAAEAKKNDSDPFKSVAESAATVAKVLLVVGGVAAGAYAVSLALPAIRAWRAGVPKSAEANERARVNREGLTFAEWLDAAGIFDASERSKSKWRHRWDAGEDPSEYRAIPERDRYRA